MGSPTLATMINSNQPDKWANKEYDRGAILTPTETGAFNYLKCDCIYLWFDFNNDEYGESQHILVPMANNKNVYFNSEEHIRVVGTAELSRDFIIPSDDTDNVEVWDAYFGQG